MTFCGICSVYRVSDRIPFSHSLDFSGISVFCEDSFRGEELGILFSNVEYSWLGQYSRDTEL